jgi:hypothetical protein
MDPNDTTDMVTEQAPSSGATDGAPSSGVADEGIKDTASILAAAFDEASNAPEPEAEASEPEAEQEAEPEAAQKPATDTAIEADAGGDDEHRIPDADFKALPPSVKKRIGHLSTSLGKTKRELEQVTAELPTLRDTHERFTRIQTFVQENQIQPENVTKMFDMAAMLARGDYKGFLDTIQPFYDLASQAAGVAIASDLRDRVDNGYMTEDDAKALTAARVQGQTAQAQAETYRKQLETRVQQERSTGTAQAVATAINQREAAIMASDPDYAQLKPAIESIVRTAVGAGVQIKTPEQALALLDSAYQTAKGLRPAKAPAPTPPRPTASNPNRGHPAPKTSLEATAQALARTL